MIVTTAQLYKVAYGKFAVGAYNINNMEQCLGLFRGNVQSRAPFIIQLSKGARKYADKRMLEAIIRTAEGMFPEAIFAVHLDHGDEEACYDCIASGFYSSVMIDASQEPFEENVAITKRVVDKAHAKGISVEAELGRLGGVEEDIKVDEGHACLTNPDEAVEFIKQTKCDSLAAAIGTSHGAYKFKGQQSLHFEVIEGIRDKVKKAGLPPTPIVMHGSSSVPKSEVERINAAGGKLDPSARGVNEEEYLPAAKLGRHQSEHRHRWTPRLDARPPRILPRSSRAIRFSPTGKNFHRGVRKLYCAQKREAGLGRETRRNSHELKKSSVSLSTCDFFVWGAHAPLNSRLTSFNALDWF